jgi:hypothetical protein
MANLGAPIRVRRQPRASTRSCPSSAGRSGRARPLAFRRLGRSRRASLCASRPPDGPAHVPGLDAARRTGLGSGAPGGDGCPDHHLPLRPGTRRTGGPGRRQHASAAPRRAASVADGTRALRGGTTSCSTRPVPDARPPDWSRAVAVEAFGRSRSRRQLAPSAGPALVRAAPDIATAPDVQTCRQGCRRATSGWALHGSARSPLRDDGRRNSG